MKSRQPRKQRKRRSQAPFHKRDKLMSVSLDKKLRKKYKRRRMPVRKGDKVEVLRGDFKGIRSKIKDLDLKKLKVTLEDVKREKTEGTEIHVPLEPSNLKIVDADLSDKKRQKIVKRVEGKFEVKKKKKKEKKEKKKKKEKGHKCPYCGKVFENKQDLNSHEQKEHKKYTKEV